MSRTAANQQFFNGSVTLTTTMCDAAIAYECSATLKRRRMLSGWQKLRIYSRELAKMFPPAPPRRLEAERPTQQTTAMRFAEERPELFKDITSLTPALFEELLTLVRPYMESPRRTLGLEAGKETLAGRNVRATAEDRLFLALARLVSGGTLSEAALSVSPWHSASSVSRDFWHVVGALEAALQHLVEWPDEEERDALAGVMPGLEGCIGLIDCCEVRVRKPADAVLRNELYSGKKGKTTITMQVIVDAYGMIRDIDGGQGGRQNDVNVYETSAVGEAAREPDGGGFFSKGEYIASDCGYQRCARVLGPYTAKQMNRTVKGRSRRLFSNLLRRYRAVNEYVFGYMKGTYKILGGVVQVRQDRAPLLFKVCALLVQFTMRRGRPLRTEHYYNREDLLRVDWEGRCFKGDPAWAPGLVRRVLHLINTERTFSSDQDMEACHEIGARIAAAGASPAEQSCTLSELPPTPPTTPHDS